MDSKSNNREAHLGMDIGSISVNTVLINSENQIVFDEYTYCHGTPFHRVLDILRELDKTHDLKQIKSFSFTGSGGKQAAELLGGHFVNEVIAQATSVSKLFPEARTVIEMGGEDSKLIQMESDGESHASRLSDFSLNSLCAAGTGSFLDQQAKRIGVPIEKEFGELAEKSENPPRIAGRCSVFAKSDMIHLQQLATPLHDIVAGLCFAVARNFKSTLGRGKKLEAPFLFQGGVAANKGMIRAFQEVLELQDGELTVPEHYASMGAIGAVFHTRLHKAAGSFKYNGLLPLEKYLESGHLNLKRLDPLEESKAIYRIEVEKLPANGEKREVFLGLDVGSLSTNLVLIDRDDKVISRRYLPTASKPLDAIRRGMKEIQAEVGERVIIKAAGTTGSGRYLTGDFIGADIIQNEITAQATAAIAHDPTVDTIFEIGGQDSKYISIRNGVVVDFEMNKVCAAGTGSFLEEQAEKLGINIREEFGSRALESRQPAKLGDRCTVFMESDLNTHQQGGAKLDNLLGGLAYSIVQNYMQKVVGEKPVGEKIFFQGGVTNNKAVVAAFEAVTGKSITIPPHFDVTGAIGVAMLARDAVPEGTATKFKGFGISETKYTVSRFTCKSCANNCEIQKIKIEGESGSLFYGGRCEKYEKEERKKVDNQLPNLFEERTQMLMGDFSPETRSGKITIGIPRSLMVFYQQFPFWRKFFEDLDFQVVLSDPSDKQLVKESLELMVSETCLPVELVHGHVNNLLNKKVDFIFLPFVVNITGSDDNPTNNCNCPWVQSSPFMIRSAFTDEKVREKLISPALHFRYFDTALKSELTGLMKEQFGIPKKRTWNVMLKAREEQIRFEALVRKRGDEVLATDYGEGTRKLVILGRPYNTSDPYLNLSLVEKLINLNTVPVPVDFLPVEEENIFEEYYMMYWPNGQKILSAANIIMKRPELYAVFLGNFRCGPDSFILHYLRDEMKEKPYLHLEVDEHSADAGMITRCEAYLDSLKGYEQLDAKLKKRERVKSAPNNDLEGRTLYFPYGNDVVHLLAAATRSCGFNAEVLPPVSEGDLEIARKHTTGNECFPAICTTGSFVAKLQEPGVDPAKCSFFMPDHNGPCRFGDYNKLHRIIFDKLGFHEANLATPSNDNGYADLAGDQALKWRIRAWKSAYAFDMLKKFQQERRPYELIKGQTDKIYDRYMKELINIVEKGTKEIPGLLGRAGREFSEIPMSNGERKPIIAVVGEIFMRDNPTCSSHMVERVEALGGETLMQLFCEWIEYSTYRFERDSRWKSNYKGIFKAKVQEAFQNYTGSKIFNASKSGLTIDTHFDVHNVLDRCSPYIHKDYDGEPAVALGSASLLTERKISGVIYILPFTCMPGTIIASVTNDFRKDHNGIPWMNFAYEGTDEAGIDTRFQAFMHQAKEYCKENGYSNPAEFTAPA